MGQDLRIFFVESHQQRKGSNGIGELQQRTDGELLPALVGHDAAAVESEFWFASELWSNGDAMEFQVASGAPANVQRTAIVGNSGHGSSSPAIRQQRAEVWWRLRNRVAGGLQQLRRRLLAALSANRLRTPASIWREYRGDVCCLLLWGMNLRGRADCCVSGEKQEECSC